MRNLHSHLLNLCQQFLGKMKSGSRSSRGSLMFCINGLITVFIFQTVCNIRWKRHLAKLVKNLLEDPLIGELNQTISLFYHINDGSF